MGFHLTEQIEETATETSGGIGRRRSISGRSSRQKNRIGTQSCWVILSSKYLDAETGLYYYGYRYYDPVSGRWLSKDPIQERGGINLYAFLKNAAILRVDKLGLCDVGSKISIKAMFSIQPLGMTPDLAAARKDLGRAIGQFDSAADAAEVVGGVVLLAVPGGEAEGASILAQWLMGEAFTGNENQDVIAERVRMIIDSARGNFNGYTLTTKVTYEECVSCWLGFSTGWKDKETAWQEYKGPLVGGSYTDFEEALLDAKKAAKEALSSFK